MIFKFITSAIASATSRMVDKYIVFTFYETMAQNMQTSTPIFTGKTIPPPPRKLWSVDSPTEQLYHSKWIKWRNFTGDINDQSCVEPQAPNFVDFQDLSDVHDSYFGVCLLSVNSLFIVIDKLLRVS